MKGRIMRETILKDLERRTKMGLNCVLRRSAIVWLLIPLLLALGCATQVPPRPTEQVRARLGTIGVVSANFVPEADVPKAMGKGAGATWGAAKGLGLGLAMAAVCPFAIPYSLVACLGAAGTPVWMAIEAVEGAKAWIPEEVEEQAKVVLKDVLDQRQIQRMLRDHLIQMGQDHARHPFVPLEEGGPKAVDDQADYRHLASRRIDTVLEVSVTNLGFVKWMVELSEDVEKAIKELEPEEVDKANEKIEESEEDEYKNLLFSLTMAARARLIRISDNEPLSAATYYFTSREHKWSEWTEDCSVEEDCIFKGSQAFGEAIEQGHRSLSGQIVDELFLPEFGFGSEVFYNED